ncbi:MAG: type I methionyl aminopeptidase [Pseudomonadaceae bacterium]|nr:type I methionyl aminopeptidase [Pseudomonadaceae bacterium]
MKLVPKNAIELNHMRAAGQLAAQVLDYITPHVQAGVSTLKLNDLCHAYIEEHNAVPAPLNYKGYPKATCISVNDVVCHGIPSADEILKDGDILNIDVTVILNGYHGDTSRMYTVGKVDDAAMQLIRTTYDSMMAGINTVKSGSYLYDIGNAIEKVVAPKGYGIVRDYCGHGLGRTFHEDPMVLHYANREFAGVRLRNGVTFTVEPMVNAGSFRTELLDDGWTVLTADRKLSAQFEHTLAVSDNGPEIMTLSPAGYTLPPYA